MLLNIKISEDFKREVHLVSERRSSSDVFIVKHYNKGILENEVEYSEMSDAVNDYRNINLDGDEYEK